MAHKTEIGLALTDLHACLSNRNSDISLVLELNALFKVTNIGSSGVRCQEFAHKRTKNTSNPSTVESKKAGSESRVEVRSVGN